jgi:hypothetical protein
MWRLRSYPKPGDASRCRGARGGSGAPLSREAGASATGHVDMRACLFFCLNLELVRRIPGLHGTDSGPRTHPGRGREPAGEANILSCATFLSFVRCGFEAAVQHSRYVAAHDPRGTCDDRCAWRNHHTMQFPMGYYYAVEVMGPEAIMIMILEPTGCCAAEVAGAEVIVTTISKPTGRRAYGLCGTFRFYTAAPPFHCPAPTDGRDLGPPCQCLGMMSTQCGYEVSCLMGCCLQGRLNRGWNRAYGSILPFSYLLRSSPLSPALLGSHSL